MTNLMAKNFFSTEYYNYSDSILLIAHDIIVAYETETNNNYRLENTLRLADSYRRWNGLNTEDMFRIRQIVFFHLMNADDLNNALYR